MSEPPESTPGSGRAEGSWPPRGGEIGALIRQNRLEAAGLGPVATWPGELKAALELVLDSRQAKFIAWGPDLAFLYNDAYTPIFPERHPQSLGRPFAQVWADIWPQFAPIVDQVLAGEALMFKELHIPMQRHGRTVDTWFTFSYTPIRDASGEVAGVLCATLEVTDQVLAIRREQQALAALRAKTAALAIVNETGAAITAELDGDRVIQMVVDAAVTLTGAKFGAFFYNVRDERGDAYMLYALSGAEREAFAHFAMPRNTALFAPTFAGEGVVLSHDILTDPRYGRNTPHAGLPIGHLPVRSYLAVPVKSRNGGVLGGLLFGHPEPGQFNDDDQASLVALASQAAVAIDNSRLFASGERELRHRARAEEQLRRLNENLEARVVEAVAERRQAELALQQAQKMEAIGKLTGGVAHDFNNLLQVVSGNLQLLSKDVAGDPRAERRVNNALAGVARGAKLASQLLAFGRRQALEPRVVNVGRLVTDMDDMLRRTLGEGVEVQSTLRRDLWSTFVDPAQLENALLNLAINARDAMDGQGRLTIEADNAVLDEGYTRTHADVQPGEYVMLAVTDTGSGMTAEVLEQVFEPFFSTKPEGKGTGLGLSMVYGFVKQSGGHAKIYSEPGQGATVKLYLPRTVQPEEVVRPVLSGPVSGGTETILVTEDDDGVRATVVETLTDLGYRVLTAKDAASALAVVESGAAIDLIFTDVVMPGRLKSSEMVRLARERRPDLAVLFTSGYTENAIVHGGRLDPGVELLSKPYTREALARKIRQVLASQSQRNIAAQGEMPSLGPLMRSVTGIRVLLVEDDPVIRSSTAELLGALGHTVVQAGSAEEAMAALQSAPVQVLMTDVGLPGLSGTTFAAEARRLRPGLAIVFATGDAAAAALAESDGAVLLRKPYGEIGLVQALDAALSRPVLQDG
jgi:signal transduction histidine kinase/DNA-binding response OmpR family regulator